MRSLAVLVVVATSTLSVRAEDFYKSPHWEGVYTCTSEKAVTMERLEDRSLETKLIQTSDRKFKVWVIGTGTGSPTADPSLKYSTYTVKMNYDTAGSMAECEALSDYVSYIPNGQFSCQYAVVEAFFDFESGDYGLTMWSGWHKGPNPSRLEGGTCIRDR